LSDNGFCASDCREKCGPCTRTTVTR
jgi:hypothetical protein